MPLLVMSLLSLRYNTRFLNLAFFDGGIPCLFTNIAAAAAARKMM